jgi:hypothetical protein
MRDFLAAPPPFIPSVFVNERNILGESAIHATHYHACAQKQQLRRAPLRCAEWHFLIQGPPDTPYAGGYYIGKIRFPVSQFLLTRPLTTFHFHACHGMAVEGPFLQYLTCALVPATGGLSLQAACAAHGDAQRAL